MDSATRERLVQEHREAIRRLESTPLSEPGRAGAWPPDRFYLLWHVVVGMTLGGIGALMSLAANAIGAPLFGERPLQLIRVYLTFPMGARALDAEQGLLLTVGAGLYILTGGLFGIAFHLLMTLFFTGASRLARLGAATAIGLGLWIFNFYLILSWLQPLLLGDNWIVRLIPPWVGALTHLTFAWTMLVGELWGRFEAYPGTELTLMAFRTARRKVVPLLAATGLLLAAAWGASEQEPETAAAETTTAATESLEYRQWETAAPGDYRDYNQRANLIQRGRRVYLKYCVGCHGELGDGRGVAAERLLTQPRDFTSGIYKFRSTDSASLPLEADLYRTITRGLSRVSMPGFPLMPHGEKLAVIEYVKTFYPRWDEQKDARVVVPVPRAPTDLRDAERASRGRIVYLEMQCTQCHGLDGRGAGATRTEYEDAWGNPQRPFDFTRGSLKSGNAPEDIYRTFHTGLRSIMPAFDGDTMALVTASGFRDKLELVGAAEYEQLSAVAGQFPETTSEIFARPADERARLVERNSWDLVAYILSLRHEVSTAEAVLGRPR